MPERIASLVPSATETLFRLGVGDRIKAVSHACDCPPQVEQIPNATRTRIDTNGTSQQIDERVREAQANEEPIFVVMEEVLHHAQPDLVIAQDACSVCGITPIDVEAAMARIEPADRPEILTLHPHTFTDVLADIQTTADAAGVSKAGKTLLDDLHARVRQVQDHASNASNRPRVAVLDWLDPPMAAGHWIPQMVRFAGGEPVLIDDASPSRYVEPDEIVEADPELLLLAPCGFDAEQTQAAMGALAEMPGWTALSAVKNDRVYTLDADAYTARPGPRLVDGLEQLAVAINPDLAEQYPEQAQRLVHL